MYSRARKIDRAPHLGQKCARRGFTTPRHIMSSGALEPKKSGDFYWSKDEVRRASPPRFADVGVCL